MLIKARINGMDVEREVEPRKLLVNFLRDDLGLTGTHIGCDTSNCGACTVIVNGEAVKSCTMLAAQINGKTVTTVEGLNNGEKLHPVQRAFLEKNGLQCGFCTSGMMMTAVWMIGKFRDLDEEKIRTYLSGNLCRCTGYQSIVESIRYAKEIMDREKEHEAVVER
ncbi:MAG: (2Fe-2S)-binding protein [Thermoplasma acidophilum]|nr:(2Fe-2S)-binding protein [Thermoplasma acidophilum]